METVTIVGYLAALCSTTSFAPQAWKIIKSRDTEAISAPMYIVTILGFGFWTAFGIMKGEWPIILTNSICFAFAGFILIMKLLPRAKRDAVADSIESES